MNNVITGSGARCRNTFTILHGFYNTNRTLP
jgi:hypothetical protein